MDVVLNTRTLQFQEKTPSFFFIWERRIEGIQTTDPSTKFHVPTYYEPLKTWPPEFRFKIIITDLKV